MFRCVFILWSWSVNFLMITEQIIRVLTLRTSQLVFDAWIPHECSVWALILSVNVNSDKEIPSNRAVSIVSSAGKRTDSFVLIISFGQRHGHRGSTEVSLARFLERIPETRKQSEKWRLKRVKIWHVQLKRSLIPRLCSPLEAVLERWSEFKNNSDGASAEGSAPSQKQPTAAARI